MNDVSWRRILEQVDNGQQLAHDLDKPRATEHAHVPKQSPQRNVDLSILENELARVTRRSGSADAGSKAQQPVRPRQPSPGQHATQLKMRMERAVVPYTSPSLPEQAEPRKHSGARNLIAITLSFTVLGFAAYQLYGTMQQNDASDGISTPQQVSKAASGNTENDQPHIHFSGNRLDLRPSLASRSDWASEKLAAEKAHGATPPVDMANITSILPSTGSDKPDTEVNETLILDRGRKILEGGHVSGARLLFEYLADRGSALGAFALAQTYDPKYVSTHNTPAYSANETLAKKWYQRAADLTEEANSEAK